MNIQIRKAKSEDAESWGRITKEAWLETYVSEENNITRDDILLKDFDSPNKIQKWRDSFANQKDDRLFLSAEVDSEVVGLLTGLKHDKINEIGAIYVLPKCHGQGIGSALIKKAIIEFGPTKNIKLNVVSYNQKAIGFYKKHGFWENGPFDDKREHLPNGKKLPEIEMIKNS
ncbi:MAG: GNAT family N-acetyltransferase [bacterium]